jgi:thiamine biosynthesis lipoprotein
MGHVLDPRTGWPVVHTTSCSAIAADATTADALSTVLGVLLPDEALARAEAEGWACLLVGPDGSARSSPAWLAEEYEDDTADNADDQQDEGTAPPSLDQ